jgi:hypothetical protein
LTNEVASGDNVCAGPNKVQALLFLARNGGSLFCQSVLGICFPPDLEAFQELIDHPDAKEVSKSKLGSRDSCK